MNIRRAASLFSSSPAQTAVLLFRRFLPPRRFFFLGVTAEMVDRFMNRPHFFLNTFCSLSKSELIETADATQKKEFPWTSDPLHGFDWELQKSAVIRIVEGREIKAPWELSRFYHAPILACAFRETALKQYLEALLSHITDWIQKNPLQRGPNWMNAMEASIRCANWCLALDMVRDAYAVADPPDRYRNRLSRIIMSLDEHGWFIEKHLEYGGANHEIAGYAGLLYLGIFLDGISPDAKRWRSLAVEGLERCMSEQVYADGGSFESSIAYHGFVVELFMLSAVVQHPASFSKSYLEKLWRMFEFYNQCRKPSGTYLNFGDNDNGRVHTVASLSALSRILWPERPFEERTSRFFPSAQIAIMRTDAFFCAVDAGPNGQQGIGGHCHNDVLSFEFSFGGRDLIIDPGTGCYTFDGDMRNRFRSTRMHSTVMVDGAEQNRIPNKKHGLFWMHNDARPRMIEWKSGTVRDFFCAEHVGYRRLSDPVTHRRSFALLKSENRLEIADEFFCNREHLFEWNFPLHPDVRAEREGESSFRLASGQATLLFTFDPRLTAEVVEIPFSPSYGIVTGTKAIRFAWNGEANAQIFRFDMLPATVFY